MAVLRNYTIEGIVPLLKHYTYQAGLAPAVSLGGFDTIRQDILDPTHRLYSPPPDVVVLSIVLEYLDANSLSSNWDEAQARDYVLGCLSDLVARTSATIVVNTLLPPLYTEDGLGAGANVGHRVMRVAALNDAIRVRARHDARRIVVVDWQRILQQLGEARAFDYRFGFMYRAPFTKAFLSAYAWEIVKVGRAMKGRIKKCLVLDCDNTLWGGVVGEDGLTGIKLDPHDFPGRCFYEFQRSVLNLASHGVAVALCSKNEESDVWDVLDHHPHCLVKREHISVWRINWNAKAENVAAIAQELNLGLDSLVFVDDSALECELVRTTLPEVAVLPVPPQAYNLPRLLYSYGCFDTLGVSAEDRQRTQMYREARERDLARPDFSDLDGYLRSLTLTAEIHRASPDTLGRIAQLVAKTNQFNLTTHRYSEAEVARFAADPDWAVFGMSAADRFGDLGLIAALIAQRRGSWAVVDTLLMSCRALGRRLEVAFVDRCLAALDAAWRPTEWTAEYIRTPKNSQVERFWDGMGFEVASRTIDHASYRIAAADRPRPDLSFISITASL